MTLQARLTSAFPWRHGSRLLLGLAALAGLGGAPSVLAGAGVVVGLAAYALLAIGRGRLRMGWWALAGADLAVAVIGCWLLTTVGLIAVAVLLPALVGAATAAEQGRRRALSVAVSYTI